MSIGATISVIVFLSFGLFGGFYFVGRTKRKNERELIESRTSDTPEEFLESFPEDQREVATALYQELQTLTHTKRVPFRRSDELAFFNMDPDDLEDTLKRIAKKFGYQVNAKGRVQLKTIKDCVEWIHRLATT